MVLRVIKNDGIERKWFLHSDNGKTARDLKIDVKDIHAAIELMQNEWKRLSRHEQSELSSMGVFHAPVDPESGEEAPNYDMQDEECWLVHNGTLQLMYYVKVTYYSDDDGSFVCVVAYEKGKTDRFFDVPDWKGTLSYPIIPPEGEHVEITIAFRTAGANAIYVPAITETTGPL
ncbi:MAG: hypothetical protein IJH78_07210 [Clostridia bacterium]|nr:hypothetical protein [Clostridia bacterium]